MAKPRPVRVPVFYDFSSTICYFTHRVLERLAPKLDPLGIALEWSPIDLVGITTWRRGEPFRPERTQNLERLSRELDVPVATPSHWMDSRQAMAVAIDLALADCANAAADRANAAAHGGEERWRTAVWSWVYEDARTLDAPDAIEAIAQRAGIAVAPPGPRSIEEVERRTIAAHAAGVRGVPTFLLDAWPVGIGIQEDDTMLDFLRRFAATQREDPGPN